MFDWKQDPHRRYNPLTREWVLVSPHRTQRPWQGQVETNDPARQPEYDPDCYLCPGNARAGGVRNPRYTSTFVFDNDFAALKPDTPLDRFESQGLLIAESEPGLCRVVCFSPQHNLTIANMQLPDLRKVVDTWMEQYRELGRRPSIGYVQIFENRGAMMGASNPHPHCQIWSSHALPNEVAKEQASQLAWGETRGTCLLCDYLKLERAARDRIVEENETFLTVVPFWAVWPFETMVISKRHLSAIGWQTSSSAPRRGMTACSRSRFLTRRVSTSAPLTARNTRSGTSTCTSIRRCCARRRCGNSWWGMRCSPLRRGTLPRSRRPSGCGNCSAWRGCNFRVAIWS